MSHLQQHQSQNLKQIQRLILSPQMQQALHLLQLPVLELSTVIAQELEENPILEYTDDSLNFEAILSQIQEEFRDPSSIQREEDDLKSFLENSIACVSSLFDHLIQQARETFTDSHSFLLAETLIGNIDEYGFLSVSLEEIALINGWNLHELEAILKEIQTFDPKGVGAKNLHESLLIQLKGLGKEESLAYKIIENHFDDVLHNRIPSIAKAFKSTPDKIRGVIEHEIARLDLHPGANQPTGHYRQMVQYITVDVSIHHFEDKICIDVNDEGIPSLRLNHSYLKMLEDPSLPEDTRTYIFEKLASGKWLLRNLHERHQTLYRISEQLANKQKEFLFEPHGKLTPLTMKEVAEVLQLHESTIARAVANKYLSCPKGIFPLRSLFTHAYTTDEGATISANTVKDLVCQLIAEENKKTPLSDEDISSIIKGKGIPCARRTVAKYRQELGLGNTSQRRIH